MKRKANEMEGSNLGASLLTVKDFTAGKLREELSKLYDKLLTIKMIEEVGILYTLVCYILKLYNYTYCKFVLIKYI